MSFINTKYTNSIVNTAKFRLLGNHSIDMCMNLIMLQYENIIDESFIGICPYQIFNLAYNVKEEKNFYRKLKGLNDIKRCLNYV